jgi:hypothetical protein
LNSSQHETFATALSNCFFMHKSTTTSCPNHAMSRAKHAPPTDVADCRAQCFLCGTQTACFRTSNGWASRAPRVQDQRRTRLFRAPLLACPRHADRKPGLAEPVCHEQTANSSTGKQ